jgi:hypothetical protein
MRLRRHMRGAVSLHRAFKQADSCFAEAREHYSWTRDFSDVEKRTIANLWMVRYKMAQVLELLPPNNKTWVARFLDWEEAFDDTMGALASGQVADALAAQWGAAAALVDELLKAPISGSA